MTRLYNDPAKFKDDMVAGFVSAYHRYVERVPGASGVMLRGGPRPGKVSVVVGGGSGHYPAFCGVVGPGMATGAVIGDIFTAPSAEQAYLVGTALDGGAGILFSYGNYAGDVMNFGLAEERLRADGVDARTVIVTDDVASAGPQETARRRGIAGDFPVFKAAGAAAERGAPIDEVERVATRTSAVTRSFGVAFAGCTFPGAAEPLFTVDAGSMEIGLGIHGEPGVRTSDHVSAGELATILTDALLAERPADADGRAAVLLNGLGATKYEELFVLWSAVASRLTDAGVTVIEPEVGELVTSLDMAGCSLTVTWLDDDLEALWRAPANTPAFRRGDAGGLDQVADRTSGVRQALSVRPEGHEASADSRTHAATVRHALDAMRDTLDKSEGRLADLDAVAGDGDHGRGMVRGARAACAGASDATLGAGGALRAAGAAWADAGGGSSGVLWGALLEAIGRALGDTEAPSSARVVDGMRDAATTVGRLGGAQVGDKCLLDALVPFVDGFAARVESDQALAEAWSAAAGDATRAAEATSQLLPAIGRARPLGEKSLGTPDPGAVSLALCLTAVAKVLTGEGDGDEQPCHLRV